MKHAQKFLSPAFLPVHFFIATILLGGVLLHLPLALNDTQLSWIDAFFTAVSAACVTGLVVVDTGTMFSTFGLTVIALLMQIGGLGVMTYTSLVFYLWRRRVSLTDRIAVGQSLQGDPSFKLGRFLVQLFLVCFCIEALGAVALYALSMGEMDWFNAFFHSVSAFCNAGFSLYPDSLMRFSGNLPINLLFMLLIFLGGIGFYVLVELPGFFGTAFRARRLRDTLSWQSSLVIRTSLWLILVGWVVFFLIEQRQDGLFTAVLQGLFQSVSARTAGFNTMDIGIMTDTSLFILILLMVIGGSPGSCAGGIKTTTLRVLLGFAVSQIKGRDQVVVEGYGVDAPTVNKAMTLVIFAFVLIMCSVFVLTVTEGANQPHQLVRGKFMELFFEASSAFGTVGLSTGLTPHLSAPGKCVIMMLMFVGRLGPIVFLTMLQSWQTREHFRRAEKSMLIG
ncbi:MAG: potassium transporter TrkH [Deltaproteobacteria bacterium HGW-Deltaproteobacteria-18]|nr:MAG: potassium transporter TrkH [Deltaproteobacteria bacterium HGW-Deltaproteobacteria-18]